MTGFSEATSVQQPIIELLVSRGWSYEIGSSLNRHHEQVLIERDLTKALVRLNPFIAEEPERAEQVLTALRTLNLSAYDDGLVQANKAMQRWLSGRQIFEFIGHPTHEPVQLIDFDNPANNTFTVSDEVVLGPPGNSCRFDIVLWVNGIPLVVGETKTNVNSKISWVKGAKDINGSYERKWPQFFVPNVLSFATEGKEFHYGAVRQPVDKWKMWGSTGDVATMDGWPRVKRSVELLLDPRMLLKILADYTLFEHSVVNGAPVMFKILPRYPQVEAAEAIYDRVLQDGKKQGLIHHTQGSGKTLAMAFCAAKLLKNPALQNPTVIIVADRTQLVGQTADQFLTTGLPRIQEPQTAFDLRKLLNRDQRGIVFSTVHKFRKAGFLNGRDNIIVLVDEAHRTQEGSLGLYLREALPNAHFFGFTGTPISTRDRNTFVLFGDPDDPGYALSTYDSDRSIADKTTVPMHVAPRLVDFHIDKQSLDDAFGAMAEQEGIDEEQKDFIAGRLGNLKTLVANPERIRAVCTDIIKHFYSTIDPLGMKAQIVVLDRPMCAAYHDEINRQLSAHYSPDESAVVMTVKGKEDPVEWSKYEMDENQEEDLLNRFRNFHDPLKFLIVTSKLGTGFNADNEGVMYLDKPIRLHTLYQTITRTNRTWRNPETGQEKKFGLIVDYFGLGDEFAKAMAPANPEQKRREIDIDGLLDTFEDAMEDTLTRFVGIDRSQAGFEQLEEAQKRIPLGRERDKFAVQFNTVQDIWETLYPDLRLDKNKDDYRWLSKVYASVSPTSGANDLLWHRLGAKTMNLVHSHTSTVEITDSGVEAVIADEDTVQRLREEGLISDTEPGQVQEPVTVDEVIDTISARLKKRLAGPNGDHPVYRSLAERLERVRQTTITRAKDSVDVLREIFAVATDVAAAEKAEDESGSKGLDLLPDRNVGALTQIFNEYKPDGVSVIAESIVKEIDEIVREIRFDGWADSNTLTGDKLVRRQIRTILQKHGLPRSGDLFDHAYAYIAENY